MKDNRVQKGKHGPGVPYFKHLASMIVACGAVVLAALLLSGILVPRGSLVSFVDGDSMLPTLTDGQMLYADVSQIRRGDIVVALMPGSSGTDTLIVKRVIAIPGDTLTIDETGVYVNSEPVEEAYLTEESTQATYIAGGCNHRILGLDEYFVMGDNRQISYDSRYFGPIRESNILYKQSTSPTGNTYAKLFVLIAMLAVCCGLYFVVESGMSKLLDWMIPAEKKPKEEGTDEEVQS